MESNFNLVNTKVLSVLFNYDKTNMYFKVRGVKEASKYIKFYVNINVYDNNARININNEYIGEANATYIITATISLSIEDFLATTNSPKKMSEINSLAIDVSNVNISEFEILHLENTKYSIEDIKIAIKSRLLRAFNKESISEVEIECIEKQNSYRID